ncbi:MAG: phage holin family protein [Longimicrobiales bacterium]
MENNDRKLNDEPGLTTLLRQLGADGTALLRSEIALAKLEAREIARVAALEGLKVGAAVALLAVGGLTLVAWLVLVIGDLIGDHYATAAAVIGLLFVAVGGVLAKRGVRGLRSGALAPDETIQTLLEDTAWAAQQLREFKTDITHRR